MLQSASFNAMTNSLPLMGIENSMASTTSSVMAVPVSLPLMGIENHSLRGHRARVAALITPHGDRKHRRRGIEQDVAEHLITPHGDRKPAQDAAANSAPPISLPLMGIENHVLAACDGLHHALITPHGDRKRRHGCRSGSDRRSHYPSWGSKTRRWLVETMKLTLSSLPLMGIENQPAAAKIVSACSISLPLMGIENLATLDLVEEAMSDSLPLMGIEN